MTPYYEAGGIKVYLGDCLEVLPTLDAVDLVIADPPYGIDKAEWDADFPTAWMDEAARLAPVMGVMPGNWNLGRMPEQVGRLRYRWVLAAHLVNGMTRGAIGYGNWIPCSVYAAEGSSVYVQDSDIRRFAIGVDEKPDHPSPKPLNVMRWIVERLPGDLILDPFLGSGTTLVAAKQLGRRGIGVEINEEYAERAVKRLEATTPPLFTLPSEKPVQGQMEVPA